MARSGYEAEAGYRREVMMIMSCVTGSKRQLDASRSGEKPLFRQRGWRRQERIRRKVVRKVARKLAWYKPEDC